MTLAILDENGRTVTENNPIIVEHNGTTGGTVELHLTLYNSYADHYYRNVRLQVNDIAPVKASLVIQGEVQPNFLHEKLIRRINPTEKISFLLRTVVPTNTSERVVRGVSIGWTGVRYPLP